MHCKVIFIYHFLIFLILMQNIASCKGIRIPESEKFSLVKSGIWENLFVESEVLGLWIPEYSSRNPESH